MNLFLSQLLRIAFLFFICFSLSGALEFTQEEQQWIKEHPVVRLGSDFSWAPYDFVDKEGRHTGIASDFLALISQKSGLKFDIHTGIWSDILEKMKQGKFDGLSCAVSTPSREEYLHFSTPYVSMPLAIVVQDSRTDIQTIDDLKGKSVAVNKGSYLHEWLETHYPKIKLTLLTSNDASLEAVSFSKVDAYIGNVAVATYIMKTHYLSNLKIVSRLENMNTNVSVAVAKENKILQNIIEKTLKSISQEEHKKIIQRWYLASKIGEDTIGLTQKEKSWIALHPNIKVGVDKAWEPFDFINSAGKHDGMSADYLALISKSTGLHFVIEKDKEWSEVLQAAKENKLDMIAALAPSDERSKYLNFTQSYMKYAFVLATADINSFFYEISDFNGKRVGVIKSYITEDILKQNYQEIEVVSYKDLNAMLRGVASGEVDAIFDNAVSVAYHIKKEGYSHIKMVTIGDQKRTITMGVTKDNVVLLSILNKALKNISAAEKKNIRDRWVSFEYDKVVDYTLVYQILGLFLLFILGTWYWNKKLSYEIQKRKESEEQLHMLIDSIPLNVIVSSLNGSVLSANAFALKTFKIKAEDIYQYNVLSFYSHPSERDEIIKEIRSEGRIYNRIVKFKRLDSQEMNIMISIMPIQYDGQKALLSIMVDLTDRIEMEENLRQAKQTADSANRSKSEFLANMSHEIRTPMNAIMGFTELLNEQIQEPRLKAYTKTIQNAGKTLLTLINDILDLSKIEAGKLEINKSAVNIFDLAEDVISMFSMTAGSKGLSLLIDIDEDIPKSIILDGIRLRQVLVNLLGNAVKFTDEGSVKLSIHAFNVDEHLSKLDLEISVHDTGMGISKKERERIFLSFEQQEGQDNRKFGGTGLGLSISKRLVEMMDGHISVQSVEEKGTTFFVYLYGVDISSMQVSANNDNTLVEDIKSIDFKPAKILVVDDIEDNRELIIKNFEDSELTIFTAVDGYEAIEQYKKENPDLILMDIRMPNLDGYEAAKAIKKINKDIPIVALTASVMKDSVEQIKRKYFDGYLRKPVLKFTLYSELSHFLPFDTKTSTYTKKTKFELDEILKAQAVEILSKMTDRIEPYYQRALNGNNINAIQRFIDEVEVLSQQYQSKTLEAYVVAFNRAIDAFDIIQIKQLFKVYSEIIDELASFV